MPGYDSLYGDMLSPSKKQKKKKKKKKGKVVPFYSDGTSDVQEFGLDIDKPSTMVKK